MRYNLFCKTNEQPVTTASLDSRNQPPLLRLTAATAASLPPPPFHSRYLFATASLPLRYTAVISEERNQTMCYIHIPFHI